MKPEDIERILASEPRITPSPGFLSSVMRVVDAEASALPPLSFPWRQATPGLLAGAVALAFGAHSLAQSQAFWPQLANALGALVVGTDVLHPQWLTLALLLTLASLTLPPRLVRGHD